MMKRFEYKKMKTEIDKLVKKHNKLIHTDNIKVVSHVQREDDDWFINTLMLQDVSAPFKYKRKKLYKSLVNQRVNLTYYVSQELIAGFEVEMMSVVRIKVS